LVGVISRCLRLGDINVPLETFGGVEEAQNFLGRSKASMHGCLR
jgi:hypothetical protein